MSRNLPEERRRALDEDQLARLIEETPEQGLLSAHRRVLVEESLRGTAPHERVDRRSVGVPI